LHRVLYIAIIMDPHGWYLTPLNIALHRDL
jgi:hypothetical protein